MIILFNKPFNVLTQFTDKSNVANERKTLSDYINIKQVYPAGRLDLDSEGLVILTDDGRLQSKISSPKFKVEKTYLVQVEGIPEEKKSVALRFILQDKKATLDEKRISEAREAVISTLQNLGAEIRGL